MALCDWSQIYTYLFEGLFKKKKKNTKGFTGMWMLARALMLQDFVGATRQLAFFTH